MPTFDSPLEFVQSMGWKFKIVGNQINLEECPICHGLEWKFFINASTGKWDCKHLNSHENGKYQSGSLVALRKALKLTLDVAGKEERPIPLGYTECRLVDMAHEALLANPMNLSDLCEEWKITEATVKKWKLGFYKDEYSREWLIIPHMINGQLYNIKYRSWFGLEKTFKREKGASSVLLNEEILLADQKPQSVCLFEGEKDAIVSEQAGIQNVVGMTGGAGTLLERWYKLLEPIETIYVAYDGDNAGKEGTQTLIKRLGAHRVRIVNLPNGKDCADVVKEQGPQALIDLFTQAQSIKDTSLVSYADVLEQMICEDDIPALPVFSPSVTRILNGGSRGGQLITVTAPPKIGKTSFCLKWATYAATIQHVPAMYWCNEMSANILSEYVTCMLLGCGRTPTRADMLIAKRTIADIPLYLGFDAQAQIDVLTQTFRDAFKMYGIKLFFFDNIHFMVRAAENKVQAMEDAVKAFKSLAMELNVHFVLIAQPSGSGGKRGADMNYYDIAWSSAFASDSDTIIILHRDRIADSENSFREEMMVKVDAGRYTPGGMTYLNFFAPMLQFSEYTKAELDAMIMNRSKRAKKGG